MRPVRLLAALSGTALALTLGACTYDYLQHTDSVGYHAGNAVKANIARETTNPTKASMYDKSGLGKDGDVVPGDAESETEATAE